MLLNRSKHIDGVVVNHPWCMLEYAALYIATVGDKLLRFTESLRTTAQALWICSRHAWACPAGRA